jgi:hypothetical protein
VADLGELGTRKAAPTSMFTWLGPDDCDDDLHTFRDDCRKIRVGNTGSTLILDFMARARQLDESDVEQSMALMHSMFSAIVDERDRDRFWQITVDERQDVEDLMVLMGRLIESKAGHPTRQRSNSQRGRLRTLTSSPDVSSSQERRGVARRMEKSGRPDLAVMVLQQEPTG